MEPICLKNYIVYETLTEDLYITARASAPSWAFVEYLKDQYPDHVFDILNSKLFYDRYPGFKHIYDYEFNYYKIFDIWFEHVALDKIINLIKEDKLSKINSDYNINISKTIKYKKGTYIKDLKNWIEDLKNGTLKINEKELGLRFRVYKLNREKYTCLNVEGNKENQTLEDANKLFNSIPENAEICIECYDKLNKCWLYKGIYAMK